MKVSSRLLAGVAVLLAASAAVAQFRVNPYLQWPTQTEITINWFTLSDTPGTLTVAGPGLVQPLVFVSTPELKTELNYASNEIAGNHPDMFPDNSNWKHSIRVTGLLAGSTYNYSVAQGFSTFDATFRTAPTADAATPIRLSVTSDSETLVVGRTTNREWNLGAQTPDSTGRPAGTGIGRTTYFLTETVGLQNTLNAIQSRNPDLLVMPGDLIQGSGNEPQRRYDEFFRHFAGEYDNVLHTLPLVAAIGNNCIFYNSWGNNTTVQRARQQWSAYWDFAPNGFPEYQDLFHRQDWGPITILTICSVKGVEPQNHLDPNRDTNRAWNNLYTFGDVPDFNPGTVQWNWVEQQLASARAAGQVIFVQWHHVPFSRGIHGSATTSNQSGNAMRQYAPLMEQYSVAGVFSGHSEVFERSFADTNSDGRGVNYWDVGVAGDGLRAVENHNDNADFSRWTADRSEPERWNGNTLLEGGKHYGFLEVDVTPLADGEFLVSYQPMHVFPLNADFAVTGAELRMYNDRVVLRGTADDLDIVRRGDTNCDGTIDFADIDSFVLALGGETGYELDFPGCWHGNADANDDGSVNFADIDSFVALISAP